MPRPTRTMVAPSSTRGAPPPAGDKVVLPPPRGGAEKIIPSPPLGREVLGQATHGREVGPAELRVGLERWHRHEAADHEVGMIRHILDERPKSGRHDTT